MCVSTTPPRAPMEKHEHDPTPVPLERRRRLVIDGLDIFHGPNAGYVLDLYDRYRHDPQSVDPQTRALFEVWPPEVWPPSVATNGGAQRAVSPVALSTATRVASCVQAASRP